MYDTSYYCAECYEAGSKPDYSNNRTSIYCHKCVHSYNNGFCQKHNSNLINGQLRELPIKEEHLKIPRKNTTGKCVDKIQMYKGDNIISYYNYGQVSTTSQDYFTFANSICDRCDKLTPVAPLYYCTKCDYDECSDCNKLESNHEKLYKHKMIKLDYSKFCCGICHMIVGPKSFRHEHDTYFCATPGCRWATCGSCLPNDSHWKIQHKDSVIHLTFDPEQRMRDGYF